MEDIRFNPQDPNEIYDLIDLLGEGSYGAVYKAVLKAEPERPPVAIKIIPAEVSPAQPTHEHIGPVLTPHNLVGRATSP